MSQQVTCITRIDHTSPYYRITHIGWPGKRITSDQAIQDIGKDPEAYFVKAKGQSHSVWIVIHLKDGKPYLTTEADGDKQDNLLSLPDCL
jgi:hypothetical protein